MSECAIYVTTQLEHLFCLNREERELLEGKSLISKAEEKARYAISHFKNKYWKGEIDPLNTVMYCSFLYWLSRLLYEEGMYQVAKKVYYLNKMMNAVDLYYEVEMPDIWLCEHPVGGVIGKARIGEGFFFYQGCTVGGNIKDGCIMYPSIGRNVTMYSDSKIIGDTGVGDNVVFAANSYAIDESIPSNCIVFGQSPNLIIKEK